MALLPARVLLAGDSEEETDLTGTTQVDVVVDMTDAGRKVAPPTSGQPVYYLPLPEGFEKVGYAPYYQRPPPTATEVERFIERVFAAQGYRVLVHGSHPTLCLDLVWGYIAPESAYGGRSTVPPGWMAALLYGNTVNTGSYDSHTRTADGTPLDNRAADDLKQSRRYGRYFVIVSAFDFQDWLHHKATLLWRAHISTPIWGHYFDQVLPSMVATAAPLLGRETTHPTVVTAPVVPDGHVVVGAPYIKGDGSPAAPANKP
jgi:hypothetical protein